MTGAKINCLRLGGALCTVQDKIFVASGNQVKAYSKKGKHFFTFETNMAEPTSSMLVKLVIFWLIKFIMK